MAVTSLSYQLSDYRTAAAFRIYGADYADISAGEQAWVNRLILRAETSMWHHPPLASPHVWSCLHVDGSLDFWADLTTSSGITVSQSGSTLTASAAAFYPSMIGHTISITDGTGTKTITAVNSTTEATCLTSQTLTDKTFSLTSGGVFYLPSDFESMDTSSLVYSDSLGIPDVRLVSKKLVEQQRALLGDSTGYPNCAALLWDSSDGSASQGKHLLVSPNSSGTYNVVFPYKSVGVGMTDTTNPYPKGGAVMADILMLAVIAHCEKEKNKVRGDSWAEYVEAVNQEAELDKKRQPRVLGRMRPDGNSSTLPFDVKSLIGTGTYS